MFCREQVAQLRDITDAVRNKGAELSVVGNGKPAQAAAFAEERNLPFALYTDPGLRSYGAADLRRNVISTFRPKTLGNAFRAMGSGHRQGSVQGDPWQQGGAFVIAPGNEVLFSQRSREAGDHADPNQLVAALAAADRS